MNKERLNYPSFWDKPVTKELGFANPNPDFKSIVEDQDWLSPIVNITVPTSDTRPIHRRFAPGIPGPVTPDGWRIEDKIIARRSADILPLTKQQKK